jgi:hypothetical protein
VTLAVAAVIAANGRLNQTLGIVFCAQKGITTERHEVLAEVLAGVLTKVGTRVRIGPEVLFDCHAYQRADFVVVHSTNSS